MQARDRQPEVERSPPAEAVPARVAGTTESLRYAVCSMIAIAVALTFLFPIYWSLTSGLRTPLDTFTVGGIGLPWINFQPTLQNWADELSMPETAVAL
jgi:multiple sugar transport system permease protein